MQYHWTTRPTPISHSSEPNGPATRPKPICRRKQWPHGSWIHGPIRISHRIPPKCLTRWPRHVPSRPLVAATVYGPWRLIPQWPKPSLSELVFWPTESPHFHVQYPYTVPKSQFFRRIRKSGKCHIWCYVVIQYGEAKVGLRNASSFFLCVIFYW